MNKFERGLNPKIAMDIGDARQRKMTSAGMNQDDIEKMSRVKFFVEANSNEKLQIWRDYHEKCNWVQDHMGFMITLGHITKRPICVEFCRRTGR